MKITALISILLLSFGQAFAEPTTDDPNFTEMQAILQKLSSSNWEQQNKAVQALTELKSMAALSLAEFLILGNTQVPGHPVSFEQNDETPRERISNNTRDYLIHHYGKFLSVPGFSASFKRVYSSIQVPSDHYRMFKSLEGCAHIQCLELFDLAMKSKEPLTRAAAYRMLRNFDLKLDRIRSLIQTGLQSVHHGEKEDAAFALLGRKDPEVLPLANLALRSLFVGTRIYGIGALAEINDPAVFPLYREGLKDSEHLVRYFTIFALGRRPEPEARLLLEQVQANSPELRPRTSDEQERLAPLKERWAETRRLVMEQINWRNSYRSGSPSLRWMEAFNTQLRRPKDFILQWMRAGRNEADLAKQVLKDTAFADPSFFTYQNESTAFKESNSIRFSGEKLKCNSAHSK